MKAKLFGLIFGAAALVAIAAPFVQSQPFNPGTPTSGSPANNDCAKFVVSGGNVQSITTAGTSCASQSTGANPTATGGPTAVNGSATTFLRSDGAPAVQKGSNAQFGIVQSDGATINCTLGVCVVASSTFGGQSVAPGGSAGVQGNGAKVQLSTGTATSGDCVKFDANGNTVANGAACPTQSSGANPSATAGPTAVNGSATTFMRSDGAPAVQKGTDSVFGIVHGDGTTVSCASTSGICVALINGILPTPTRAGDVVYWNGSAWASLAGNNSGTRVLQETSSGVPSWSAAGTGTVTSIAAGTGVALTTDPCIATCTVSLTTARQTNPTTQVFTSGSGTYTTPANTLWIEIVMVGAGGGGTGSGTAGSGGNGGNGGDTCWNTSGAACTSPVLKAAGGAGNGGAGGAATGGDLNLSGGTGPGTNNGTLFGQPGMPGCSSAYGGAGQGTFQGAGSAGGTNTGAGGAGGGGTTTVNPNTGGACGAYLRKIIGAPAGTYTYAVGAGGAGGTAGTSGFAAGAGAAGNIMVIEHYN